MKLETGLGTDFYQPPIYGIIRSEIWDWIQYNLFSYLFRANISLDLVTTLLGTGPVEPLSICWRKGGIWSLLSLSSG